MNSTWLEEHIETFVFPNLGYVPIINPQHQNLKDWTPTRIKALQAVWSRAKARSGGRPILLAGRDVYLLQVLAELEEFPTTFRPDISGASVTQIKDDYSKYYCIDTGNKGTIPKTLGCEKWDLIYYASEWNDLGEVHPRQDHQVFPRARSCGHVRNLYHQLEGAPKYWQRAAKPGLPLPIDRSSFDSAAMVTIHIVSQILGKSHLVKKTPPIYHITNMGVARCGSFV